MDEKGNGKEEEMVVLNSHKYPLGGLQTRHLGAKAGKETDITRNRVLGSFV